MRLRNKEATASTFGKINMERISRWKVDLRSSSLLGFAGAHFVFSVCILLMIYEISNATGEREDISGGIGFAIGMPILMMVFLNLFFGALPAAQALYFWRTRGGSWLHIVAAILLIPWVYFLILVARLIGSIMIYEMRN